MEPRRIILTAKDLESGDHVSLTLVAQQDFFYAERRSKAMTSPGERRDSGVNKVKFKSRFCSHILIKMASRQSGPVLSPLQLWEIAQEIDAVGSPNEPEKFARKAINNIRTALKDAFGNSIPDLIQNQRSKGYYIATEWRFEAKSQNSDAIEKALDTLKNQIAVASSYLESVPLTRINSAIVVARIDSNIARQRFQIIFDVLQTIQGHLAHTENYPELCRIKNNVITLMTYITFMRQCEISEFPEDQIDQRWKDDYRREIKSLFRIIQTDVLQATKVREGELD